MGSGFAYMERTGTSLWVALQMIAATAVSMYPYMPTTSRSVLEALGVLGSEEDIAWVAPTVVSGTSLGDLPPLFSKVELDPEDE